MGRLRLRPRNGRLVNMIALVTGAGRGIGRATAELFAREGASVVLCSRTRQELLAALSAIRTAGGTASARVTDISSPRQARALVDFTVRRYGRLDLLVNNAGILGPRVPLVEYSLADWSRVLNINLSGTFYVTQRAARVMAGQKSGCIITVSSSVGRTGRAGWGAYAVSKFGVEGLSQVLAEELRSLGVRSLTFTPAGHGRRCGSKPTRPRTQPVSVILPSRQPPCSVSRCAPLRRFLEKPLI